MASPGALAGSLKHRYWNPRKSDFFPSFDAEIELDRKVIRPFKPITGKLILTTSKPIRFNAGIRVQLDANVKLRYVTKSDNRSTTNWGFESILEGAPDAGDGSYVLSPVREQLLGEEDESSVNYTMEEGTWEYIFSLPMTGEPLAAPFKSEWGCLQFNIAAYMGCKYCYVQVAEQIVGFAGFKDLTNIPEATEPLIATSGLNDSIFSSKPFVTFTLKSDVRGYHPGEQIPFSLQIDNPKGREVKSVLVKFVRRVTYNARGALKHTNIELDSYNAEEEECGNDILHEGYVTVPKHCVPTYVGKSIYALNYYLMYEVKISDYQSVGKGQAEILIGTTKPSAASLVNKMNSRRESSPFYHNELLTPSDSDSYQDRGPVRARSNTICSREEDCNSGMVNESAGGGLPRRFWFFRKAYFCFNYKSNLIDVTPGGSMIYKEILHAQLQKISY